MGLLVVTMEAVKKEWPLAEVLAGKGFSGAMDEVAGRDSSSSGVVGSVVAAAAAAAAAATFGDGKEARGSGSTSSRKRKAREFAGGGVGDTSKSVVRRSGDDGNAENLGGGGRTDGVSSPPQVKTLKETSSNGRGSTMVVPDGGRGKPCPDEGPTLTVGAGKLTKIIHDLLRVTPFSKARCIYPKQARNREATGRTHSCVCLLEAVAGAHPHECFCPRLFFVKLYECNTVVVQYMGDRE